jgi:hypothetical protein
MDEAGKNSIIAKAYKLIETPIEPYAPREPPKWQRQVPPTETGARNFEGTSAHVPDSMVSRRLDAHVAADRRDKAVIRECLEVIADEAGTVCGELSREIKELREQLKECQGQIALLRGLASTNRTQPKRITRGNSREQDEHAVN